MAAEEALKLFQRIGDREGEARALLILASVDYDRSRELDNAAMEIGRQIGDRSIVADALSHIANDANLQGRKDEALQLVTEAVEAAESSGDWELLADTIFMLGTIEHGQERLAAFERVAALEPRYRRRRRFARRLSVAASLVREGFPDKAAEWFRRCTAISREFSDAQMEGASLRGLASIERASGNVAKADELDALANVMCPLPDRTALIKAVEARDLGSAEQMIRSMFAKKGETH